MHDGYKFLIKMNLEIIDMNNPEPLRYDYSKIIIDACWEEMREIYKADIIRHTVREWIRKINDLEEELIQSSIYKRRKRN